MGLGLGTGLGVGEGRRGRWKSPRQDVRGTLRVYKVSECTGQGVLGLDDTRLCVYLPEAELLHGVAGDLYKPVFFYLVTLKQAGVEGCTMSQEDPNQVTGFLFGLGHRCRCGTPISRLPVWGEEIEIQVSVKIGSCCRLSIGEAAQQLSNASVPRTAKTTSLATSCVSLLHRLE